MSMMTLQKSKMKCASETQKSNYLENETIFFVQVKNTLIIHYGLYHGKNSFPEDVTFNIWDE